MKQRDVAARCARSCSRRSPRPTCAAKATRAEWLAIADMLHAALGA